MNARLGLDLLARRRAVVPPGVPLISELSVERAEGPYLITTSGRKVIDLATGIGVMDLGHSHPRVIQAIREQLDKLQHTCIHVATYEPYIALCEKLAALFPHARSASESTQSTESTKVILLNSGAEAVENAVKIARQATGRPAVIAFSGAFHGRTMMGMSLTSKVATKLGCGPYAPEVYRLPFPDYSHDSDGLAMSDFVNRELERFESALLETVPARQVAAVIIEVVQGEGGFIPCPPAYLQGLKKICEREGILLICDEVQSGFGRTGRWAAYEHMGITPDLSTWAKAMGGGLPISAVIGRSAVMDAAVPGTIGGTYGGNPVSCASALATIEIMEELDINTCANELGEMIREAFKSCTSPALAELRGIGAMLAIELRDPRGKPATKLAQAVAHECLDNDLLILRAGVHGNVIRLLPPLNIPKEVFTKALKVLVHAVNRLGATQ